MTSMKFRASGGQSWGLNSGVGRSFPDTKLYTGRDEKDHDVVGKKDSSDEA